MEQSLLHEAAEKGKLQSLNALIKLGANVNAHDKDGNTASQHARSPLQ